MRTKRLSITFYPSWPLPLARTLGLQLNVPVGNIFSRPCYYGGGVFISAEAQPLDDEDYPYPRKSTERFAAYHEAGHAVIDTVLGVAVVEHCDIKERESSGGNTVGTLDNRKFIGKGREAVMPVLVGLMAGVAAELLENPTAQSCYSGRDDRRKAREFAEQAIWGVVDASGNSFTIGPEEVPDKEEIITYMLADAELEADRLVEANLAAIRRVAKLLLKRRSGRVEGHEVASIVEECRGK
jgi:hypothetical protein